jgi:signal transduction histidine kinase
LQAKDQKRIVLFVKDTGVGIPEHLVGQIFDPFFRINLGKVYGTGLGLTISREIVHLHGGSIRVESTVDVGTTFYVELPMGSPQQTDGRYSL